MKRGYIISLIIIAALAVFIFFKLRENKKDIDRLTSLAEEKITTFPVNTFEVKKGDQTKVTMLSGRLSAAEEIILTSALPGRVAKIHVENGDVVKEGSLLISLEDDIVKSEVEVTKAAYDKAKADLEKFRRLRESNAVTSQQLELLQLNEQSSKTKYEGALQKLKETRIVSPINGVVHQVMTKVGSLCGPTTPVCELVNVEELKLRLGVGENIASRVQKYDSVQIDIPVINQSGIVGTVAYVGVKPGFTGLFPLEVSLKNTGTLKAGYMAEVSLNEIFKDVIAIPKMAVQGSSNSRFVFVVSGEKAKRVPVKLGPALGDEVIIQTGLNDGQFLITEGANRLSDGYAIKVVSN
jgi:RND family efflux transporter MFP subunit